MTKMQKAITGSGKTNNRTLARNKLDWLLDQQKDPPQLSECREKKIYMGCLFDFCCLVVGQEGHGFFTHREKVAEKFL